MNTLIVMAFVMVTGRQFRRLQVDRTFGFASGDTGAAGAGSHRDFFRRGDEA